MVEITVKIMKIIFLMILLTLISILYRASTVYALTGVTTERVITSVGAPSGPPPIFSPSPNSSSIPFESFTFFCQKDTRWSGTPYACESIAAAGCGPTSFAMVLSTFGKDYNPAQAAKLMSDKGFATCGSGSRMEYMLQIRSFLNSIGLDPTDALTKSGQLDADLADKYLNPRDPKDKYLIIGSSARFPSCNCNHIFVVEDYNPDNKTITVRDPVNCTNDGQERAAGRSYPINSFNWLYAYGLKKITP